MQTKKGAVANDSASTAPVVTVHDRLAAGLYPENRARIHGEDAVRLPHELSPKSIDLREDQAIPDEVNGPKRHGHDRVTGATVRSRTQMP
jgi:hypothetical protein